MLKTIQGWWRREEGTRQMPELTLAITKIMVGMMTMDGKMDEDEKQTIIKLLNEQFGLSEAEGNDLIVQASDTERTDLSFDLVVKQITDSYNEEERAAMLAKLWRVAMADGDIDFLEEQYINRLAGLIGVPGDALNELKDKQQELFPQLNESNRYQHNPVDG